MDGRCPHRDQAADAGRRRKISSAPTAKIQPAKDCRINPYTDLAIVREPGQTQSTLFCAGLLKAKHALLRCRLGAGPGWELIA